MVSQLTAYKTYMQLGDHFVNSSQFYSFLCRVSGFDAKVLKKNNLRESTTNHQIRRVLPEMGPPGSGGARTVSSVRYLPWRSEETWNGDV